MSRMLSEIEEQPEVLERALRIERSRYRKLAGHLRTRGIDLVVIAARGSSDNASLFGRYLIEIKAGIAVSLAAPSVYTMYNARLNLKRALVIGVSQSGEALDICRVLEAAKKSGAFTIAVTNVPDSTMAGIVDETFLTHAGAEHSVAATKTYTGQMLHFYMLAAELGGVELMLEKIPEYAAEALSLRSRVEDLAGQYSFMENCVIVGRGYNYGNAYEFALKLMETCYVVAERFSSADFLHGPVAIIERRFPVFMFAPTGVTSKENLELLNKLQALDAHSMVITNDKAIKSLLPDSLVLSHDIEETLTPIPFIIPAQMFAAFLSERKGLDPDSPRSLSKVTQTI